MAESWEDARLTHRSRQADSIAASALSLLTDQGASALTMAAIADKADISRQTLYRYYKDVDAVFVGIAELITVHDEAFTQLVREQPNPPAQLDLIARTATSEDHGQHNIAALLVALPPAGRNIITHHQATAHDLLAEVLQRGIEDASFGDHIQPATDAPLILGLLDAADPAESERAIALVRQLVDPTKRNTKK